MFLETNIDIAIKTLKRTCLDDDPQQAKAALLQWTEAHTSGAPVSNLGDPEKLTYVLRELAA